MNSQSQLTTNIKTMGKKIISTKSTNKSITDNIKAPFKKTLVIAQEVMLCIVMVATKQIRVNACMQQIEIDKTCVAYLELKQDIILHGFLQPLKIDKENQLINGRRRWEIACELGIENVPCIVTDYPSINNADGKAKERYLLGHNVQRTESYYEKYMRITRLKELYNLKSGVRTDLDEAAKKAKMRIYEICNKSAYQKLKEIDKNLGIIYEYNEKEKVRRWMQVGIQASLDLSHRQIKAEADQKIASKNKIEKFHYETTDICIYNEDCFNPIHLPNRKARTIITSPPYLLKRLEGYNNELGREHTVEEYVERLVKLFNFWGTHLTDDGTLYVNLDDVLINGQYKISVEKFVVAMVESSWLVVDKIYWCKHNAQFSYSKSSTRTHEVIYKFAKREDYYHNNNWLNSIENKEDFCYGTDVTIKMKSFIHLDKERIVKTPAASTKKLRDACRKQGLSLKHSSTFPLEIPYLAVNMSSEPGDLVIDCFSGTGTTMLSCALAPGDRSFCGYELSSEYVKASAVRIALANDICQAA